MREISVPSDLTTFGTEWLTSTLRQAGHLSPAASVAAIRQEPLTDAKAIFGSLRRLHLEYAGNRGDLPSTMIAKLPSDNPASVAFMRRNGGYRNEARFYQEMAGAAGFRTPRCYVAALDETDDRFVLLLEDLSACRQAANGQLSPTETMAVTRALAASHAAWWQSGRLASFDWLLDIRGDSEPFYTSFKGGWPKVAQRLGGTGQDLETLGQDVAETFWSLRELMGAQPVTFGHMDVRAENLFFAGTAEQPEPIFIDFQNIRQGRGAASLGAFLAFVPERGRHEEELVRAYHEGLCAGGVRDYTLDQCRKDYWCGLLRRFMGVSGVLATVDADSSQGQAILDLVSRFGFDTVRGYVDRLSAP